MSNWDFSGLFWKVLHIEYFRKQHWRSSHFSNIDTTCLHYIIHRWSHTTNVTLRFACRPPLQIYKNNDRLPFVIYRRHIWRNIFRNLMSLTDVLIYIYVYVGNPRSHTDLLSGFAWQLFTLSLASVSLNVVAILQLLWTLMPHSQTMFRPWVSMNLRWEILPASKIVVAMKRGFGHMRHDTFL